MEDSIFTKIVKGDIPAHKIYEDEYVLAFLDIHPIQPGHTLVIPKKQVEFIWDLDDATYEKLMLVVKKLGKHLKDVLKTSYVGIKVSGNDVPHTHVHLIPFSTTLEFNQKQDMSTEPDHASLADIASKLAF